MDQEPVEQSQQPVAPAVKPKKTISITTALLSGLVIALVAFVGGTRTQELATLFGDSQNKQLSNNLDFASVEDVYDKLREKFDGKLDPAKLVDGAKKGMVEATGDPYTTYFTDEEAKEYLGDLEGKFTGIGAELDKRDNQLTIVSTLDDSPAKKAGLQANDIIVKVNDEDASDWSVEKAVSQIRGEKGTTVKLNIVRDRELKEFSIVRAEIINPSVKYEVTADNIGYVRLSRFAETDTVMLMQRAAQEFKHKNVKGVVLDVRGNGGGYLLAAQAVSSLWLQDKTIVQERRDDKVVETLQSEGNAVLENVPTVVLVDGGSASASEIVAGALQDNKAATLVGEKTFGKGSVQEIATIGSGGQLKVTIAKWYTPNGKNISKEGIKPDVEVGLNSEELKNGRDTQKEKAFEIIKQR